MTTRVPVNMLRVGTGRAQRAGVHVSTLAEITHQPWREQASCAGLDPTWWDPSDASPHTRADRERWAVAVDVCNHCPVQAQCAADAGRPDAGSVRGGLMVGSDGHLRRVPRAGLARPVRTGPRQEQVNLVACPSESARRRHQRRQEVCATCGTTGKPVAALAACGTNSAKKRHRRRGEKCVPCRVSGLKRRSAA